MINFEGDWDYLAHHYGYTDEQQMLVKLYGEQKRSISELAVLFGVSNRTVRRRLEKYEIPARTKGGDNNPGRQIGKLSKFDQRILLTAPLDLLVSLTGISRSLLYKYRRSYEVLYTEPDSGLTEVQC